MRPAVFTLAVLTCASAAGALLGMRQHARPAAANALVVTRTQGPIKIDGELDEPSWTGNPARTGAFPGKPYSDARMLWDDTTLYLALYAADEDIESRDDAFRLVFDVNGAEHRIDVSPKCVVTNGRGVRVACDTDGAIDDPSDMDEEWVVEMALPLASIGIEGDAPFELSLERCDTPKNEPRSCTSWKSQVVLR